MSGGKVALEGLRVFVVEDEFAVLLLVEDMLVQLGCAVVASVSRIAPALEIARSGAFDAAVLDINVAGEAIYPVVEILASRNVPIAFSTGYGAAGVAAAWRAWPILQKPYSAEQLAHALLQAIARVAALGR